MRLTFLLAVCALCVAGCDSAKPEPPVVTPPVVDPPVVAPPVVLRHFDLTGLPAETEIELTDADTIAVPGLFGAGRPAGLSLGITGTSGATAIGTASALVVRAVALGDAAVTLAVSAPGYRDTTATLAVRVVTGVCPARPPGSTWDYAAVSAGQAWSFDVTIIHDDLRDRQNNERATGRLDYAFGTETCFRGTRTIGASVVYVPDVASDRLKLLSGAVRLTETPSNTVTLQIPRGTDPFYLFPREAYLESRYGTPADPDVRGSSTFGSQFTSGIGLTRFSVTSGGFGQVYETILTRRP